MELSTAEKIKVLAKRKGKNMADVAADTGQSRQNFSNKTKRADFKESELKEIAASLNCTLSIQFIDNQTGEAF